MSLKEQLKSGKIIKAIDFTEKKKAIKIASRLKYSEEVGAIKVGLPLILSCNLKIIKSLKKKSQKPVILDLKISDIPKISSLIVQQAIKSECDAIVVQGFVGKSVLKQCVDECENSEVIVLTVTGMSHEDGEGNLTNLHAQEIVKWAVDAGAHGIIVPANKPDQITKLKQIAGDKLLVIATGIGSQGGDKNIAIKAGADSVIMGTAYNIPESSFTRKIGEIKYHLIFGIILVIVVDLVISKIYQQYRADILVGALITLAFYLMSKLDEL